jgi:tetratricopeptide (TPR) repeat protein
MSSDPILDFSAESAVASGDAPLVRARMLCQLCRYSEAHQLLSELIETQPRSAEAWALVARIKLGQSEPLAALHAARAAISIAPGDEWAARLESAALIALERHDEAVRAAENAVRLAPLDWRSQAQLAEALTPIRQRSEEAAAAARRAVELAPDEARSHIAAGNVAAADGRRRDAAKEFVRALALDPQNVTAHASLERIRQEPPKRVRLPRLSLGLRRA